jgi:LAO/AO transport system kinase
MGLSLARRPGWKAPVVPTSSEKKQGIADMLDAIDRHWDHLRQSGELAARQRAIAERRMLKAAEEILHDQFDKHRHGKISVLTDQMMQRQMYPYAAARTLLNEIQMEK